jgi:hypothetical protein
MSTIQVLTPTTKPTTKAMTVRSQSFAQIDRSPVISVFPQKSLSVVFSWGVSLTLISIAPGNGVVHQVTKFGRAAGERLFNIR